MVKSQAKSAFDAALLIVETLALLERNYVDPPRQTEMHSVEGLRAACAVLVVAAFEEFVKQCFIDQLGRLQPHLAVFEKLPEKLRTESVYKQLTFAMEGPGQRVDRMEKIQAASARVSRGEIHAESFSRTVGNPNSETITNMFRDVAMSSFFDVSRVRFEAAWKTPISQSFVKDKLDEIVRRRHQVAHSGRALNISRVDLKESIRFIKKLAIVLEAELKVHVRSVLTECRP
jgi:hypothetical protein